jgi:hypothetical protein
LIVIVVTSMPIVVLLPFIWLIVIIMFWILSYFLYFFNAAMVHNTGIIQVVHLCY